MDIPLFHEHLRGFDSNVRDLFKSRIIISRYPRVKKYEKILKNCLIIAQKSKKKSSIISLD